ncbi:RNA polymerase sigma factor [Limnochorda pilosa]|uniref:RNA polymerase sigma 70 n=1 Tax=Limnochorda pilosa TaxID=1555112 RepID=A0A0K2SJB1_LIMPI|nr:sigma-70 family RNA polymerase sigma factor [Limnochorda pilosa]BAS26939.1 RNA polymerase sigma 70 [Limnochorda pilosa]
MKPRDGCQGLPGDPAAERTTVWAGDDPPSDEALLEAVARGDEGAFERVYDRYAPAVYGHALRQTGDPSLAEEIVQNTFLSVWRSAVDFRRERGSGRVWLFGIARHRTQDLLRRRRRWEVHLDGVPEPQDDAQLQPAEVVERRLLREAVHRSLDRLSPVYRDILHLSYLRGLSHREIAQMLDLPLGTVKSRIRLGLERLNRVFWEGGGRDGA